MRGEVWLADFEVDDICAGALHRVGPLHHFHRQERLNVFGPRRETMRHRGPG